MFSEAPRLMSLTVVILTRHRSTLLRRAISSVQRQEAVWVDLVVLFDACPVDLPSIEAPMGAIRSTRYISVPRGKGEQSGPPRIAKLRNLSIDLIDSEWCAFLDDDNTIEPEHYSSLVECANTHEAPFAHSWRQMWRGDNPFPIRGMHPWCVEEAAAKRLYDRYEAAGIYQNESSFIKDQVVPGIRELSMVDTSEWIFKTDFLTHHRFELQYSIEDWREARSEDNKLLDRIVALNVEVPCTCKATLHYFLEGYSNDPSQEAAALEGWTS